MVRKCHGKTFPVLRVRLPTPYGSITLVVFRSAHLATLLVIEREKRGQLQQGEGGGRRGRGQRGRLHHHQDLLGELLDPQWNSCRRRSHGSFSPDLPVPQKFTRTDRGEVGLRSVRARPPSPWFSPGVQDDGGHRLGSDLGPDREVVGTLKRTYDTVKISP